MDNNPEANTQELQPWDWLIQINQKLTFLQLKVINHKEISEDDYELLRVIYGIYWRGEFPLYQTQVAGTADTSVQTGLFADTLTDAPFQSPLGTEVEQVGLNQIKE
jgi:uncharacterized protein YfkK (UPF0435 family)